MGGCELRDTPDSQTVSHGLQLRRNSLVWRKGGHRKKSQVLNSEGQLPGSTPWMCSLDPGAPWPCLGTPWKGDLVLAGSLCSVGLISDTPPHPRSCWDPWNGPASWAEPAGAQELRAVPGAAGHTQALHLQSPPHNTFYQQPGVAMFSV